MSGQTTTHKTTEDAVDTSTEDEVEREANKRVSLAERYEEEVEKIRSEQRREENSGDETDEPLKVRVGNWVIDRIDGLEERMNQSIRTIDGIETKPPMNATSIDDALDSVEDVEQIRFTFQKSGVSQWYTWEPSDPEHPLHHITDYYTDTGSISGLYGEEVRTAQIYDNPHITYPTPYETKTGHYRFKIYEWVDSVVNNTEEGDYYKVVSIDKHRGKPVSSDVKHHNVLATDTFESIGGAIWFIPAMTILMTFCLGVYSLGHLGLSFALGGVPLPSPPFSSLVPLFVASFAMFLGAGLTVSGIDRVSYKNWNSVRSNSFHNGFAWAFFTLISPLMAVHRVCRGVKNKVMGFISDLNSYEPHA